MSQSCLGNAVDVYHYGHGIYLHHISTDPGKWQWLIFQAQTKKVIESGEVPVKWKRTLRLSRL